MNVKRNWAVARVAFNTANDNDLEIVDNEDDDGEQEKEDPPPPYQRYSFISYRFRFFLS